MRTVLFAAATIFAVTTCSMQRGDMSRAQHAGDDDECKKKDCDSGDDAPDGSMAGDAGSRDDDAGARGDDAGGGTGGSTCVGEACGFTLCDPDGIALGCCSDGGDCARFNPCIAPEAVVGCAIPRAGGGFVRTLDDHWRRQPDAGWHWAPLGSFTNWFVRCGSPPERCAVTPMCYAEPCPGGQVCNADGISSGCDWATPAQRDGGLDTDGESLCRYRNRCPADETGEPQSHVLQRAKRVFAR